MLLNILSLTAIYIARLEIELKAGMISIGVSSIDRTFQEPYMRRLEKSINCFSYANLESFDDNNGCACAVAESYSVLN